MTMSPKFSLTDDGDGFFTAEMPGFDGPAVRTLNLVGAEEDSAGTLDESPETAAAVVEYLLGHQDPSQLPAEIELGDVLAAYEDAVTSIPAIRERRRLPWSR